MADDRDARRRSRPLRRLPRGAARRTGGPRRTSVADRRRGRDGAPRGRAGRHGRRGAAGAHRIRHSSSSCAVRMREADAGIAAVREPPPGPRAIPAEPAGRRPWRLSRRELLQGGHRRRGGPGGRAWSASRCASATRTRRADPGGDGDAARRRRGILGRGRRLADAAARIAPPLQHRRLRRVRGQRRGRGARPVVGLHAHGLHAALPARLAGPALPVPRRQLRPRRAGWPTAAADGAEAATAATRRPTRSSCPTSCGPRVKVEDERDLRLDRAGLEDGARAPPRTGSR